MISIAAVIAMGIQPCIPQKRAHAEEGTLRIGETVTVALTSADPPLAGRGGFARRFALELDGSPVTITLESHDVDVYLRVEGADGTIWVEDDDSGIETDARVVLAGRPEPAFVVAVAKKGVAELVLSAQAGVVPLATGVALLEVEIAWRRAATERALARGDRAAAGGHLLEEGNRRASRGQFPEAQQLFEQSLAIKRELEDEAGIAAATRNLGNVCVSLGDFPRARELYEESLALARTLEDQRGIGTTLGNLGNVYLSLGDFPRAGELFEEHVELARAAGDRAGEARSIGNLGIVLGSMGDYPGARRRFEELLAIARDIGDRSGELRAIGNLGSVCTFLGDYPQARELLEQNLALSRELGDDASVAMAVGGLGNVDMALGDYASAREHYDEFLALALEVGDRGNVLRALSNLGSVYALTSEYQKALEHFEESLALALELGDRAGESAALLNMGNALRSLGELPRALELGERALTMAIAMRDRQSELTILGELGSVHLDLGDCARSLAQQERRLALARELGDRAAEAATLGDLGDAHVCLGSPERAREYFEQELELARELGARPLESEALGSLGALAQLSGDSRRALSLAGAAEELAAEMGSGTLRVGFALTLAEAALSLGDAGAAQRHLEQAEQRLEVLSAAGLDSKQASGLRGTFEGLGAVAQDLTHLRIAAGEPDESAREATLAWGFAAAGRWKGRALLEGIAEHRLGARSAQTIELLRARREVLASHAAILAQVSEAIHAERPRAEIEELRARAAEQLARARVLAERLRVLSPRDGALVLPVGASPSEMMGTVLRPGELLVEYVDGVERLYAYVLGQRGIAFLDLGARATIRVETQDFLGRICAPEAAGTPAEVARAGRALFERLLAPVLVAAQEPVQRLVLVPNAALAALPFEALVVASTSAEPARFDELTFVLDRYELTYGPSAPVLLELAGTPARPAPGPLLVLADPLYRLEAEEDGGAGESQAGAAGTSARARPSPEELPRLPGTRAETLAIARLLLAESAPELDELRAQRSASLSTPKLELHLGSAASRARLAGALRGYSVLHLACHGLVDGEFPQRTGLAFSPDDEDEGWFTLADALELDLDADLVVLSACQTARGEARAGEGVESLARAFLYAGARGLVASLWPVDDVATAQTMEAFYRCWLRGGLAPAQALREAKLALRRGELEHGPARGVGIDGSAAPAPAELGSGHPFFWAPFLHVGLGR